MQMDKPGRRTHLTLIGPFAIPVPEQSVGAEVHDVARHGADCNIRSPLHAWAGTGPRDSHDDASK